MLIPSYKNYLASLEKKPRLGLIQKILFLVFVLALIIGGFFSAFSYYLDKKEEPARAENFYLQTAALGFNSITPSLNEILDSYKVAGAKVIAVDQAKESSAASSAFPVSVDDLSRTQAKIETIKKNIQFQKDQLLKNKTPQKFENLESELENFYEANIKLLDDLQKNEDFMQELLLASGPQLYLPVFTNESLWQTKKKEEIVNYYKNIKVEADKVLTKFGGLTPPPQFQEYYKDQLAYLELLVKTSDTIISLLQEADNPNTEEATQVEKAYQVLIGAKRENENLTEKLLTERLRVFSLKDTVSKFARIGLEQNSLKTKLEESLATQTPEKELNLKTLLKIFTGFTNRP